MLQDKTHKTVLKDALHLEFEIEVKNVLRARGMKIEGEELVPAEYVGKRTDEDESAMNL